MYEYSAKVIDIHDGDTIDLKVDLGFNISYEMKVRLYGINCPELSTQAGKDARDYLKSILPLNAKVIFQSHKDKKEKYGRYLGKISFNNIDINVDLIVKGHAVSFMDK